ncbi:MAG TPA: S-methyl-5'-thioadenosine phosphorylase, partial [Thermoplasmatales archaeon]|nr:S-methyl-5'-thioadenosine phosphorylase [Thermoplasmatales archaeon]
MRVGVISGHKIGTFTNNAQEIDVETPYGSVSLWYSKKNSREVFFVNRHGKNADDPPHMVSYRAIIYALKVSGVDSVLSIGTVGSLNPSIRAGDFVIPHDFIDFTKSRNYTFY